MDAKAVADLTEKTLHNMVGALYDVELKAEQVERALVGEPFTAVQLKRRKEGKIMDDTEKLAELKVAAHVSNRFRELEVRVAGLEALAKATGPRFRTLWSEVLYNKRVLAALVQGLKPSGHVRTPKSVSGIRPGRRGR